MIFYNIYVLDKRIGMTNIKNIYWFHAKYPLFLADFTEIGNFLDMYSRNIFKCQISLNFVQWKPSCSMRTDGRTIWIDINDEANIRFSQFCDECA